MDPHHDETTKKSPPQHNNYYLIQSQNKSFTTPSIKKSGSLSIKATAVAVALAVNCSYIFAQPISSWDEFSAAVDSNAVELDVNADLNYDNTSETLKAHNALKINWNGFGLNTYPIAPGSLLTVFSSDKSLEMFGAGQIEYDEVSGNIIDYTGGIQTRISVEGNAQDPNSPCIVSFDHMVFQNSQDLSDHGGAFSYIESTTGLDNIPYNEISISNSVFANNFARAYGGAIFIDRSIKTTISNSLFEGNSTEESGGALLISRSWKTTIKDTNFINNSATSFGGAIYLAHLYPSPIGSSLRPAIPRENKKFVTPMILTISAENKDVLFDQNSAAYGSDIYINMGDFVEGSTLYTWRAHSANLNLSAGPERTITFNGNIEGNGSYYDLGSSGIFETNINININQEENSTGTVTFNGIIDFIDQDNNTIIADLNFYRGTVNIGHKDTLKTSGVMIMGDAQNQRNLSFSDKQVQTYTIHSLGAKESGEHHVNLTMDVDLANNIADSLSLIDHHILGNGSLSLDVGQWNILSDMADGQDVATVTLLEGDSIENLSFGLLDEAQSVNGKLYKYNVTLDDASNGTYTFSSIADADPEIPIVPQPSHFNPEVYAGVLIQKTTQTLQHEISQRLFNSEHLNNGAWTTFGRVDGSALGGQVSLNVEHYDSDWDLDYGIALFSAMSEPQHFGKLSSRLGMYGGFITASGEDRVNDVSSQGGFLGLAAKLSTGQTFADWHANIGYLASDVNSHLGNSTDIDNYWIGSGLSLGMHLAIPNTSFSVIPSLDVIYTYVNGQNFHSAHDVKVSMDSFSNWEVSPGIRIESAIPNDWRIYVEGRYVWNDDNSGATAYGLTDNEGNSVSDQVLPDLKFGDYAEVSFGIGRDVGNWNFRADVDCQAGDTQGWSAAMEAQYRF